MDDRLASFVARGHRKVFEHNRWLRDTSKSDAERAYFGSGCRESTRPSNAMQNNNRAAPSPPQPLEAYEPGPCHLRGCGTGAFFHEPLDANAVLTALNR